jgi:hypothetical protein
MLVDKDKIDPGVAAAMKAQWNDPKEPPEPKIPRYHPEIADLTILTRMLERNMVESDSIFYISGTRNGYWFDWVGSGRDYRDCMGDLVSSAQRSGRLVDGSCPWTDDA